MCGIVGYVGDRNAFPILVNGLKRLEYRGYDSSGVALAQNGEITLYKKQGMVKAMEEFALAGDTSGSTGIAHTRWATHGQPSDKNAHPHVSNSGNLVLVHNGIIENYQALKELLQDNGFEFHSETDTEVLVNFIQFIQDQEHCKLRKAVRIALTQVTGAYAICIYDKNKPEEVVVAKLGSPLVVGLGINEKFIGSDATPFLEYTKDAIYLEDGEMATLTAKGEIDIRLIESDRAVNTQAHKLQMDLESIEKGGYDYFMMKEIYEQPRAIYDSFRGRLLAEQGIIKMSGLEEYADRFRNADRIIMTACGTSWHSALVAEYLFEEFARIPVEVEYGSEFRYRNPIIHKNDVVIAISQSGETADTLAAIKMAKEAGAMVFGICNVPGSTIARETHAGAYTHAGPEIGVASTKAFTSQVTVLTMMALELGKIRGEFSTSQYRALLNELSVIPKKVEKVLESKELVKEISALYKDASNVLYLGRGVNFPIALEGALKLKEISYIHAEGYPAAEMKHGPIALIDENMPVIVVAPNAGHYEKLVSNVQEVKARHGKVIAVVTEGDTEIVQSADHVIEIPETLEALTPLLTVIPLQLLSYYIAVMRGCDVDRPRNLAKSVTVE
ncbi:MAG TPA: glutamine--fructose-6-phosphate transaminase (isomerizing) [Cryomorphaceae bacterium]|nr:glutamine--fructose-6-phosphate transaminase (isomerizing) [Cryomorphaceae bacterium]|tara:strand:- start:1423 stop:3267 length:1845 start_codon:yes stop_codon:yes gene_type:complete